ncbi:MAG: two-component sensor histidine kinase [Planctomycetes bacterium]|nr:two-component sensor histidine kinase [Planctomycetota bacterium]
MPWFVTLFIGLLIGVVASGVVMLWALKTQSARIRSAERRARSAERLAELGAMTGGLAHEIKNPLSTVGLNAQLLSEGIEELAVSDEEKGRLIRRVQSLRREVERLRGILTDFLQFAGELRLERKPSDLNLAIEELVDFFLPQAEKQGVRLRSDLTAGPLTADVDAAHLKQALLNLLLNATQAMSAQPADSGKPRELIVKTGRGQDADKRAVAQIHVIDTGPGMTPETIAKIFQPYFTTKSGGTGLGLPTSRRIVEAHDGRLEVHSEPGQGTDFSVTIPIGPVGGGMLNREEPAR